jgi:hypothetical protein
VARPDKHRPVAPRRVQHGGYVSISNIIIGGIQVAPTGRTNSTNLNPDRATKAGQPSSEMHETWFVPRQIEGDRMIRKEHQIHRPTAAYVIGQIDPIRRAGVMSLWSVVHRPIVCLNLGCECDARDRVADEVDRAADERELSFALRQQGSSSGS